MLAKLLELDRDSSRRLRVAEQPGIVRSMAAVLAHSGDSWFWFLGLILTGFFGTPYWKTRALFLGVSILITAVIVVAIKFNVRRRRPEGEWGAIYRQTDPHSFPSGHAARAMLLAVLAVGIGPGWFGVLLAAWAPLVVLARVAMGVHYLSDVLAGALFGACIGYAMLQFYPWFG